MLARCGAAGCILVLLAFLFAWVAIGREAAHVVLIVGSYGLLGFSGVMFLAGEAALSTRRPRAGAANMRHNPKRGSSTPVPAPADQNKSQPAASVDDLVGMLDNTLKLASAVPAGHLEPVNVPDLLGELAARRKSERLILNVRPRSLLTLASRPALSRALEILVETPLANGFNVSPSCDQGTSALVVHVDDNGPGVPQAERQRIFEWHYYMSTPPSTHKGWRVELVIARQIMRSLGGDIRVGPSPLGGARYTAKLPLLGEHETGLAVAS
jgi:K+-sensing histidine kinase KdpD